jgi:hypothetical protein
MNKIRLAVILACLLLLLHPVPVSAYTGLTLGVPVAGSLAGTGDQQYYEITVASGQHLFVILDADDNYDSYSLYIKFGSEPTTIDYDDKGDSPHSDQAVEIASTQAGTYYIMVRSELSGGNYTIVAHNNTTFPTLTVGTPRAGSLQDTYDIKYYQVTVAAGQHLFAVLDAADNYDNYDLYIKFNVLPTTIDYDDSGESPNADQAVEIASTQAGIYYIMVRSTLSGGSFTLVAHTNSSFPSLTLATTQAGSLQDTYDIKYYQVTVSAGEHLFIVLDAADNYDNYELYIKFNVLPTTIDYEDSGESPNADQAVEIASTQAGIYYIMVRSTLSGGSYTIIAHTNSTFPALSPWTLHAGSLQDTYDIKYYQVTVPGEKLLTVILDGADNYDNYDLYIKFGALPTTIDYDDKGDYPDADQVVQIAITQAGTYYIMVRSTLSGGSYSIKALIITDSIYMPAVLKNQ